MAIPKFPKNATAPSFHLELKSRVNGYFEEKGISTSGNWKLYTKAIFLVLATIALYVHLVFFTPIWWVALIECVGLGLSVSAIGFNIMHDGAHGSFSNIPWVNRLAAYTLSVLGGSAFMWNIKHNIIHHAYTNVDGVDDDIDAGPLLRLSSTQKKRAVHNYQHFYFWFLYCLLYIYWVFVSDYQKYFKGFIGEMPLKKMSTADHVNFWVFKVLFYSIFIIIPIVVVGFVPWVVGFLTFTMLAGFVLSIVFQLAHTVEHTEFPVADVMTNKLENEWTIHQLKTTANFAMGNKLVSWYVGGLNFQVEHHLFPKISHVHYPAISKIIERTCKEFDVPYIAYKRMITAVSSHLYYIKTVGQAA